MKKSQGKLYMDSLPTVAQVHAHLWMLKSFILLTVKKVKWGITVSKSRRRQDFRKVNSAFKNLLLFNGICWFNSKGKALELSSTEWREIRNLNKGSLWNPLHTLNKEHKGYLLRIRVTHKYTSPHENWMDRFMHINNEKGK